MKPVHRGPTIEIDSGKLGALIVERGLNMTKLAALIGSNGRTISVILSRGTCRQEMLTDIAKALSIEEKELLRIRDRSDCSAPEYYRLRAGLTRDRLSEKSGVCVHSITNLERGNCDVLGFTAACLAKACGVPIGVYLGYE